MFRARRAFRGSKNVGWPDGAWVGRSRRRSHCFNLVQHAVSPFFLDFRIFFFSCHVLGGLLGDQIAERQHIQRSAPLLKKKMPFDKKSKGG